MTMMSFGQPGQCGQCSEKDGSLLEFGLRFNSDVLCFYVGIFKKQTSFFVMQQVIVNTKNPLYSALV